MSVEQDDRKEKLERIRAQGMDPYPSDVNQSHTVQEVGEQFEQLSSIQAVVAIVGRIRSLRKHGGSTFLDLEDSTGRIQCYLKEDVLGETTYKTVVDDLDEADFLSVQGTLTTTKRGERTVLATRATLLSKTLRPLPKEWFGLKDIEGRFRKRYLDLLLNPEVKNRFIQRSRIISAIRKYFDTRGFLEVSTPTLQPIYGGGFARPFKTHHNALDQDMYLCISDEMYLKRLIVGGYDKVYEIYKVFRNEGIDHDHNPEFTMLEAQVAYTDYRQGMDVIEEVFESVAKEVLGSTAVAYGQTTLEFARPWKRLSMVDAIQEYCGINVLLWKNLDEAHEAIAALHPTEKASKALKTMTSTGECIGFIFEEWVEEKLIQPTIIFDYPVEISPLAKKCPSDQRFTQRFEYFVMGSELGNNYTELNDPIDLYQRFIAEKKRESAGFDEAHQTDNDYIEAIEHGFPPTCGLAIGIDRAVMMLTNAQSIKEVIFFPTLKSL